MSRRQYIPDLRSSEDGKLAPDGLLLIVHILAGFTALTAGAVAALTKILDSAHR